MLGTLWLIPALPLIGFLILVMGGNAIPRRAVSAVGAGSVLASAVLAGAVGAAFARSAPAGSAYSQTLFSWFKVGALQASFGLYLDALSVVMIVVVTFVAFLIHLYSIGFMAGDEGYRRFFAYMNLFVASMLILVLADNLLVLYLGWEGVGLCSYLLIGFWYKTRENAAAALKAFIVTRVGDTALLVGVLLLLARLGTLQIQPAMSRLSGLPGGTGFSTAVALLLLGGAVGKSAQLPLQTWLPDAMAGPTPVSALIHAATMVTAGVYLIARTNAVFSMSPVAMSVVAIVGAATLLMAGLSACVTRDIKRILAYSTMSQIGYMVLALGAGAWSASIYHFATHALFKSALFLAAGVLITALGGEHDIFKMGGLRKAMPGTFLAFLAAAFTLAAIPPLSATFNSKDAILDGVLSSPHGGRALWIAGVAGAVITAVYTFRLVAVVFFGETKTSPSAKPGLTMMAPLGILAGLSAVAGLPELVRAAAGSKGLYSFLRTALPGGPGAGSGADLSRSAGSPGFQILYAALSLAALLLVYAMYVRKAGALRRASDGAASRQLRAFLFSGWGFDRTYDALFVGPFLWITGANRNDIINIATEAFAGLFARLHELLSMTVTGNIRSYLAWLGVGSAIIIGVILLL